MKFINKKRLCFIICFVISMSIFFGYKADKLSHNHFISNIADSIAPVEKKLSSALYIYDNFVDKFVNIFVVYSENEQLKEKNLFLEKYYYLYQQVNEENIRLRLELNFNRDIKHKYITAQVIARNNNAIKQQIIIDAGSTQGVMLGHLAVLRNQLLGRVINLTNNTSTILLLNDQLSRIPAISVESSARCIISGNSTNLLRCNYLNEYVQLKEGELVVTSGDSLDIIPGLLIGSIIMQKNTYFIKPTIDFDKLEFIHVLMP
jgi:rod shape-determining protein MreC